MSLILRVFPLIAHRSKPFSFISLPFPRNFLKSKTATLLKRRISIVSASSPSTETLISDPKPVIPVSDSLEWVSRTGFCGDLSVYDVGKRVRLCGWVALHRIHGGVTFLNLRDHTGIVQITTIPHQFPDAHSSVNELRLEYVIAVEGIVRARPSESVNKKMKTGTIEVAAEHVEVLNSVRSKLPFLVTSVDDAKESATEEVRLRYRYLDLRRQQMKSNLMLRHNVVKLIRRYLEDVHGFVEVETPILSRSTPEGARDYLVPSRVQPGTFYALPQSPQLFKQMLMVSGFDKYYQIAKCFRDEDLRADRQPEFTQLDMELAFTPLEDMLELNEDLIRLVFKEIKGIQLPNPFPRITYAEAMSRYGSDKPDLRFNLELKDVSNVFSESTFKVFADALASGGFIKALCVPSGAKKYSNTALKKGDIYNEVIKSGAKGLPFLKVLEDGEVEGIPALASSLGPINREQLLRQCSARSGDLILFAVGHHTSVNKTLDRLRVFIAQELGLVDHSAHSILWVTDFPMFEWNSSEQRLEALHHPFTAPNPDDMKDLSTARALAYDMVYNGVEIGGGSLRIYKRKVQEKVLEIVGITPEQAEAKFGYLLEALDMGAPPHAYFLNPRFQYTDQEMSLKNDIIIGTKEVIKRLHRNLYKQEAAMREMNQFMRGEGFLSDLTKIAMDKCQPWGIAFGLDRLVMLLAGANSIRDVIAFPKTTTAQCALTWAPSEVDSQQLKDLSLPTL